MRIIIALLAAVTAIGPLSAQDARVQRELIAARDTVWRAFFRNDTALLRRFIPPAAATLEGRDARWSDRPTIAAGARQFAQSNSRLVELAFANTEVAQSGHSALVRSSYTTVIESGGRRDTTKGRATELFVRIGDTWMNPYWQLEPSSRADDSVREIPLPDTLGANFAIGDSASKSSTLADYDALVGTWEFRFQASES